MAERNFDDEFNYEEQEGHRFTLGGYTFRTLPVAPPGAFLMGGRGLVSSVRFLRRVVVPEDRAELERVLEMSDASAPLLDAAPELLSVASILLAAEENADKESKQAALEGLRLVVEKASGDGEPSGIIVSAHEVDEVAKWLIEETIGRPTKSPSPSSGGGRPISNGSKAASSKAVKAGKT